MSVTKIVGIAFGGGVKGYEQNGARMIRELRIARYNIHGQAFIRNSWLCVAICLLFETLCINAQDLEPRSYINLPVDQNFLVGAYAYSEGELTVASSVPLKDVDLEVRAQALAYAHTFSLAGNSAKVDVVLGHLCYEGSAIFLGEFVEAKRCGYVDPLVRLAYNFYGAKALSLGEFSQSRPKGLVMGTSLQVGVPLGSYEKDRLFNGGTNRWMIKPEIGMSYRFGGWSVDAAFSARFYSDNDHFFGGIQLEQDPLFTAQTHLILSLPRGAWLALNGNFFWGGKTTKTGIPSADFQKNSRLGITFNYPINRQHSIKLVASSGVVTRIGNDFDNFLVAWQYRW